MTEFCEHFRELEPVSPSSKGCEDSEHAHALQHFNATGHPVIAPLSRSETWGWCYVHRRYYDPMPANRFKRRSPLAALFGRSSR